VFINFHLNLDILKYSSYQISGEQVFLWLICLI